MATLLWVWDPLFILVHCFYVVWQQYPHPCELAHTPLCTKQQTHPLPTIPTHIANVEGTEKHFHVPAMPSEVPGNSDNVTGTWNNLSASSLAKLLYTAPLHCAANAINRKAQEVPGRCISAQLPQHNISPPEAT